MSADVFKPFSGFFLKLLRIFGFSKIIADGTLRWKLHSWQRRVGVEPTRDRAERPPSRFEDGETHRDPYTSMSVAVLCH